MRTIPQRIWDIWNAGGPAVGPNGKGHGRVTVEIDWFLNAVNEATSDGGGWVNKETLTTGAANCAATDGDSVWILSGTTIAELYRYDPTDGSYTTLTAAPHGANGARLLYDDRSSAYAPYLWAVGMDSQFIDRYSIQDDTWESSIITDPETSGYRADAAVGFRNNQIIVAGGFDSLSVALSTAYIYDIALAIWRPISDLPKAAAALQGTWHSDKFYVFGGWVEDDSQYEAFGAVYDPVTDVWTELSNVPYDSAVSGGPTSLAISDGTILVAGGFGTTETASAYLYNISFDTWDELPDAPFVGYKTGVVIEDEPRIWTTQHGEQAVLELPILEGAPNGIGSYTRGPVRWWQRSDNSQVETEIPNIEVIDIDRSIDQDAATCKITLSNQWHFNNGDVLPGDPELGQPGYFTWSRGESTDSQSRWGQEENDWNDVIVPDALLRTYQGYGGVNKAIGTAIDDGNLVLTGVWLVDSVRINTTGKIEIACRDMAKLLIEQQVYPPLAPANLYPLMYSRWGFHDLSSASTRLTAVAPALFGDVQTTPLLNHGITNYAGVVPQPDFPDYEGNKPGNGYWLGLTDGHIYSFGNNAYHGQLLVDFSVAPIMSMEHTIGGDGYYVLYKNGYVATFGDATNWGWNFSFNMEGIARNHKDTGYWTMDIYGSVFPHGFVASHGNCPTSVNPSNFWLSTIAVDIAGDPIGDGYWLLDNEGHVYAKGSASYYGQPYGARWTVNNQRIRTFARIVAHPYGKGYWVLDQVGNVYAYGAARHFGQFAGQAYAALGGNLPFANPDFPDYMCGLIPTPSGDGYWLLGTSGGVYPFGDANSLGGLNAPYEAHLRVDGNYDDYADIIKEFALWAGFWLYPELDSDNTPSVYGNIETTGAFASDQLDEEVFDKKPVIDPMTKLKEVVGYQIYVDDEGAFRFESPNIYAQGNFDESGVHTDTIPEIDEEIQLTDYAIEYADKSARSEVIVSTSDPTEALDDTITTRFTPSTAEILRGMNKPAMWVNGVFTIKREQEIMAELISLYIWLAQRQGSVSMMANPAIQINDQVRIWERVTSETYIHYVRGVNSHMDLVSGEYMMNLTTHWMGDGSVWAVDLGLIPYTFDSITTKRELTYVRSTSDLGGTTLSPDETTDGNLATAWRVVGGNGQLISTAVEYIEYELTGNINRVGVYGYGANNIKISVMEGGIWQSTGGSSITYDPIRSPGAFSAHTPNIGWVASHSLTDETGVVVTLPRTYAAERLRITLSTMDNWKWGPQYYLGGIRAVEAGLT